jgi:hypothetical protein
MIITFGKNRFQNLDSFEVVPRRANKFLNTRFPMLFLREGVNRSDEMGKSTSGLADRWNPRTSDKFPPNFSTNNQHGTE